MVQVWCVTKCVMACRKKDEQKENEKGLFKADAQHFEGDAIEMGGPRGLCGDTKTVLCVELH